MSRGVYFAPDIEEINSLYKLDDDANLFRYMDFSKYISLLESKELYFCNSKYFEDKYEGVIPAGFYKGWTEESKKRYEEFRKKFDEIYSVYVNCWNVNEQESYALWKIYTNPSTGVCVKTTVGSLKESLNNKDIRIYKVNYINSFNNIQADYEPPFYFSEHNSGWHINKRIHEVYKYGAYNYENEVRALFVDISKEPGINFPVDLNKLIEGIYVSPFAPKWFFELVKDVTYKRYNFCENVLINRSEILV